jgi:hypothetical protein
MPLEDERNTPPIPHDPENARNDLRLARRRRRRPSAGRWTIQIRELGSAASGAVNVHLEIKAQSRVASAGNIA